MRDANPADVEDEHHESRLALDRRVSAGRRRRELSRKPWSRSRSNKGTAGVPEVKPKFVRLADLVLVDLEPDENRELRNVERKVGNRDAGDAAAMDVELPVRWCADGVR